MRAVPHQGPALQPAVKTETVGVAPALYHVHAADRGCTVRINPSYTSAGRYGIVEPNKRILTRFYCMGEECGGRCK